MDKIDKYLGEAKMKNLFKKTKVDVKKIDTNIYIPAARGLAIGSDMLREARVFILNNDIESAKNKFDEGMAWVQKAGKILKGKKK